ncbi:MAG: molybdenum cofactor guanylyltransferase MobA [Rhodospirillaceae bacterium]|nr:molybdenum cofactor guanylyltransferase MobA [Rhodospirillaceae bacterium]|tara:strand:- start:2720 stop:3352 length:633 start_codon:yes stop_codon:yes gene_type:complete
MTVDKTAAESVVGVVLAGGLARRMGGGDKGLLELDGRPMLDHVIERLCPQVRMMALNANGDRERFSRWGLPVTPDVLPGNPGPLVGVLTGLDWAFANLPGIDWVVTAPTDAPFLPHDLVSRMVEAVAAEEADMACAVSGDRRHPVVGLWPVELRNDLRRAVIKEEVRKVDVWTGRYTVANVAFDTEPVDPFFNANDADDLAAAQALVSGT